MQQPVSWTVSVTTASLGHHVSRDAIAHLVVHSVVMEDQLGTGLVDVLLGGQGIVAIPVRCTTMSQQQIVLPIVTPRRHAVATVIAASTTRVFRCIVHAMWAGLDPFATLAQWTSCPRTARIGAPSTASHRSLAVVMACAFQQVIAGVTTAGEGKTAANVLTVGTLQVLVMCLVIFRAVCSHQSVKVMASASAAPGATEARAHWNAQLAAPMEPDGATMGGKDLAVASARLDLVVHFARKPLIGVPQIGVFVKGSVAERKESGFAECGV